MSGGDFFGEVEGAFFAVFQLFKTQAAGVCKIENFRNVTSVFSFEGLDEIQAVEKDLAGAGVVVDTVEVLPQAAGQRDNGLMEIGLFRFQSRGGIIQPGHFAEGASEFAALRGDGKFTFIKVGEGEGAEFEEAVRVLDGALAGGQFLFFAFVFQFRVVYFFELVADEIDIPCGFESFVSDFFLFGQEIHPMAAGFGIIVVQGGEPCEFIQEAGLLFAREERLVFMGPVKINQAVAENFEQGEGAGRTVGELAAARGGDGAFEQEVAILTGFRASLCEELVVGGGIGSVEDRFDGAGIRTRADEGFVGAFAKKQIERAEEDGFSRAGFSGNGIKSRPRSPGQLLDQSQILYAQGNKTGRHGKNSVFLNTLPAIPQER